MKQIHLEGSWIIRAPRDAVYRVITDFENAPSSTRCGTCWKGGDDADPTGPACIPAAGDNGVPGSAQSRSLHGDGRRLTLTGISLHQ